MAKLEVNKENPTGMMSLKEIIRKLKEKWWMGIWIRHFRRGLGAIS